MATIVQPQPKKASSGGSTGLLIGLVVAGVLCVALGGTAGWLWTQRSSQTAALAAHESDLAALASTLGQSIATDTNAPVDWSSAWQKVAAAATAARNDLGTAQARVAELEAQVDEMVLAQAQAQQALAAARTKADAADTATQQLADLRASTQKVIEDLQAQLAAANQQLEQAKSPEIAGEPAAEPAADTGAPAPDAAEGDAAADAGQEPEVASESSSHTFAPEASKLLKKASYSGASQKLTVVLANDEKLQYRDVPQAVYDALIGARVVDVYFRMKILGVFACNADDKVAVRAVETGR